ncbi:MAG: hydroxyethylthiazole kinase [Anaerocolumna sp.]
MNAIYRKGDVMLKEILDKVKSEGSLIHCITNYVTANDCANILLACGGSPIMADDIGEVEEITALCQGLTINIGTLNQNSIKSMILAGKRANMIGIPVILDPVGAGASALRTQSAYALMEEIHFSVLRGNISELKTLYYGCGITKGVDVNQIDKITEDNLNEVVEFAKKTSEKLGTIVVITGPMDIVTDGKKVYVIRNGHPIMGKITGSGCMLSALVALFAAAHKDNILLATVAAVITMGLCGEKAYEKVLQMGAGSASFRNYLIDAVFLLTGEELNGGANYEIR